MTDDPLKELDEALERNQAVDELLNALVAAGLDADLAALDEGERNELFARLHRLVEVSPDETLEDAEPLKVNLDEIEPLDFEAWLDERLDALKDRYREAVWECKDVTDALDDLPEDKQAEFYDWRDMLWDAVWSQTDDRLGQLKTRIHRAHLTCKAALDESLALPLEQQREFNVWLEAMSREVWKPTVDDVLVGFLERKKTAVH